MNFLFRILGSIYYNGNWIHQHNGPRGLRGVTGTAGHRSGPIVYITGKEWHMKTYDIIVIGSGSGGQIVENALNHGLTTALVDKGPAGGTCLNVG